MLHLSMLMKTLGLCLLALHLVFNKLLMHLMLQKTALRFSIRPLRAAQRCKPTSTSAKQLAKPRCAHQLRNAVNRQEQTTGKSCPALSGVLVHQHLNAMKGWPPPASGYAACTPKSCWRGAWGHRRTLRQLYFCQWWFICLPFDG